jgi:hypothetical protein
MGNLHGSADFGDLPHRLQGGVAVFDGDIK